MGFVHHVHNLVTTKHPFSRPRPTATVTATAAANGKRQRSAAPRDTRTLLGDLGYVRPVTKLGSRPGTRQRRRSRLSGPSARCVKGQAARAWVVAGGVPGPGGGLSSPGAAKVTW